MELEQRIQLLEDREQLKELGANYCFLVDDDRYKELINEYFTLDAKCDFRNRMPESEPLISQGREEILAFFQDVVANTLKDMSHTTHNHRFVIDGDNASGDCYFELTARDANSSTPMVGAGRYSDKYQRDAGKWRFSQRNADIFFITPQSQGW